jgi:LAO/AO transport system kinase
MSSTATLVDRMLAGDRVALAKLITLVENRHADTTAILSRVHHRRGQAYIIGVTGPPGAGKSTLVDRLIEQLRARGHGVGIVAIDPSSPFSGGAVLGDRIRMQRHALDEQVFIRSLSTRGSHGGLARATHNVVQLFDAFGKDFILVETVGVGQTELDVMGVADTTIVVLVPEAGDTIQTMKAGLLEIADIFVVNKADRDGAMRIKTELEMMLQLRPGGEWAIPVLLTEAAASGKGVTELLEAILRHRQHLASSSGRLSHAAAARREEFVAVLREEMSRRVEGSVKAGRLADVIARVEEGVVDPYRAALEVMADDARVRAVLRPNNDAE